jgi:hypothetical protein
MVAEFPDNPDGKVLLEPEKLRAFEQKGKRAGIRTEGS